jgi:hypothetical protein
MDDDGSAATTMSGNIITAQRMRRSRMRTC